MQRMIMCMQILLQYVYGKLVLNHTMNECQLHYTYYYAIDYCEKD